ncbi:MAG: pyrroline-5-carboxylate reductase [Lachnospiraceae bacterium]|nr:pyrroline-5-carboxylate reductase [Lachnospiraceae bacterium]
MKIGFIGLGNMAKAMIGGMLSKEIASKEDIIGSAKTQTTLTDIEAKYGIETTLDNSRVAQQADILILAVKPQFFSEVIPGIREKVKEDALIISIAAGRTIADIESLFGREIKLVRCMPNTPALVGAGCTGVCRNEKVSEEDMTKCMELMESFGIAQEVPERLMDAVSGVSGCSPAYVFMFLEALADGAVEAGMQRKQAYTFAAQAVMGSARLMLETGKHPGELKDMVTSPAGTTIEGVRVLEEKGFRGAVIDAVKASVEKNKNM